MKIRSYWESHIIELEDGSQWRIFSGDMDVTLDWKPETDLTLLKVDDEVSRTHLVSGGGPVRVVPASPHWPVQEVKSILRDGRWSPPDVFHQSPI